MKRSYLTIAAVITGGFLATMIFINGELSTYTSFAWSSMVAHMVGATASWGIWKTISKSKQIIPISKTAPIWAYFGGVVGALVVINTNITVTSSFGLIGSLSIMLLGQTFFSLIFDYNGWVGVEKRKLRITDLYQVLLILVGSLLIIIF